MIDMLTKPSGEIGLRHIQALIESEVCEDEQIEFKEGLSTKGEHLDPWIEGQERIGERAKNSILLEAVAFANAFGGAVFLGIRESETKPAIAIGITPILQCEDFAERLKLLFRDRVEPQLPQVEVVGIPTEGEGGVVVIRVSRSRLAPHRITKTRICPIRRADRCEEMSMREIQDMTLNTRRGLERVDAVLCERSHRFAKEFHRLATPDHAVGFRLTGVPIGEDIRLDKVFQNNSIVPDLDISRIRIFRRDENGDQHQVLGLQEVFGFSPGGWRPILRATRAEDNHRLSDAELHSMYYLECHSNGLVELGFLSIRMREAVPGIPSGPIILPAGSPTAEFMNLAIWIERVRNAAASPTAEFAIEVEVKSMGENIPVGHDKVEKFGEIQQSLIFPRYSFVDSMEISFLAAVFETDFWHSLGRDVGRLQGKLMVDEKPGMRSAHM